MAIHSLNSLEMPLLASEFSCVLPHVICGQPRRAENVLPNLSATAVVPGSWAYEQRGQPNEGADCDSSCRCQEDSNDEKDSR